MAATDTRNLDHLFHALSDATRRELLMTLAHKPASVTELARPYATSLNAISKHLKVLEGARLIQRRQIGTRHEISANMEALRPVDDWITVYRKNWKASLESLDRFLKSRSRKGDS